MPANELKPCPLEIGDLITLKNGDTGHVHAVCFNGYEYLMDRTGRYHHSDLEGRACVAGFLSDVACNFDIDWSKSGNRSEVDHSCQPS